MISDAQRHAQRYRGTIFAEQGEVLSRLAFAGEQYLMRIRAPKCAAAAEAGNFVHLCCDTGLPMRRPMSIMRVGKDWFDILFKIVGQGLELLSRKAPGEKLSVLGPIGKPFTLDPARPRALLIGGGLGIPPMVFVADALRQHPRGDITAILGSEIPFPFAPVPSSLPFAGSPEGVDRSMPLLESWGVTARLTSRQGFPGCFNGLVTDLARRWLDAADAPVRERTMIYACGPTPMLKAVAALAAEHGVRAEVSLEEYMACAVGGCAGCAVRVNLPDGPAMQRVCVDGPVFDASTVDWDAQA